MGCLLLRAPDVPKIGIERREKSARKCQIRGQFNEKNGREGGKRGCK
jgi:hypothetical protein